MSDTIAIPQRINERTKILIFTLDEIAVLVLPIFIGLLIKKIVFFLPLGIGLYLLITHLKKGRGSEVVIAALYWRLPHGFSGLRAFPPSTHRVWRG